MSQDEAAAAAPPTALLYQVVDGVSTISLTYPDAIRLVWRMPDGSEFDRLITPPPTSTIDVLRRSRAERHREHAATKGRGDAG